MFRNNCVNTDKESEPQRSCFSNGDKEETRKFER